MIDQYQEVLSVAPEVSDETLEQVGERVQVSPTITFASCYNPH